MKKMLAKNAEIKSHNMDETARFQQISEKKFVFTKGLAFQKFCALGMQKKLFADGVKSLSLKLLPEQLTAS